MIPEVSATIRPHYFKAPRAREAYETILSMVEANEGIDVITVSERAKNPYIFGDLAGLVEMVRDYARVPETIPGLVKILQENQSLGELESAAQSILEILRNKEYSPPERMELAHNKITQALDNSETDQRQMVHVSSDIPEMLRQIEERSKTDDPVTGLRTGLVDLDEMTTGLQPGELVVLAGRPSMGKSAAAGKLIESCCRRGGTALLFSLEMTRISIIQRAVTAIGQIDFQALRTGRLDEEGWGKLSEATAEVNRWDWHIDETAGVSLDYIRSVCRRIAMQKGKIDLVVVDYLQLMSIAEVSKGSNRAQDIGVATTGLKALAKQLSVPVVVLSQLNRSLEQRQDKRPIMSDLRESGAIEQDADLIVFLYREEVYVPETAERGICEWIVRKQRNGPIGTIRAGFQGRFLRFSNLLQS
jgi:replicative DNA helicase